MGVRRAVLGQRAYGESVGPTVVQHPLPAAGLAGAASLVPGLPVGAWLLAAAGVAAVGAACGGERVCGHGRRRVLAVAAAVLAVAGTTGLVGEHRAAQQRRTTAWAHASQLNRAQLLPRSPGRVARTLLGAIAEGDTTVCATLLAPAAGDQLAHAVGAADCADAVKVLAARVVDPRRYPAPDAATTPSTLSSDGQSAGLDLCGLRWDGVAAILHGTPTPGPQPVPDLGLQPGPQLGRLDLSRVLGQGLPIVHITPC